MPHAPAPLTGPMNALHLAARCGSIDAAVAALSSGSIDIDQGDLWGITALMFAAVNDHPHIVRILLNKGANVSIVAGSGAVLHYTAFQGHVGIVKMLIEAGADVHWVSPVSGTPLHMAAEGGKVEIILALIEAGANIDSRSLYGETPLFVAARGGHVDGLREVLRAKPDPTLTSTEAPDMLNPLEVAASCGHSGVVRELIQHFGIEACGGGSGGVLALSLAATKKHLPVMAILLQAGVVDTGEALLSATRYGGEAPAKLLLQQQPHAGENLRDYVNYRRDEVYVDEGYRVNLTPVFCSLVCRQCSPRVLRLLVDAGADTSSPIEQVDETGKVWFNGTPLAYVTRFLGAHKRTGDGGMEPIEDHLRRLQAVHRLLLTLDAVHAVSWLWPRDIPTVAHTLAGATTAETVSTPLRMIFPILRRRARRPRVLLATLFRPWSHPAGGWVSKTITHTDALAAI